MKWGASRVLCQTLAAGVRASASAGPLREVALGVLITTLPFGCGSEVHSGQQGGGHAAAGGSGQGGMLVGGTGGTECNNAGVCNRFGEWDYQCEPFDGTPHRYSCTNMHAVDADCVYLESNCTNCADWCCPPEPWEGPTYAELDSGPASDSPAPPGCERQPSDDYACVAQGKWAYAVHCPGLDTTTAPPGCTGNPYGADSCGDGEEGHFCCPAQ